MRHIFISYYHDDNDFAEVLINRIEKAGFETWVDNDRLHAGEDWRAEIDQAIKNACALIVIMTPEARSSEYVTYEWAFAWGAGVKVIPVLYKDTKLHPRLEALQYLNFTSRIARPWDALLETVKNAASLSIPSSPSASSGLPPYLKQPIELLDSADPLTRERAVESLMKLNHPTAHKALTDALQHPLQDVRIQAAIARAKFKEIQAIPILLEAVCEYFNSFNYFNYRDGITTSKAFKALVEIGFDAIPGLSEALHNGNTLTRIIAVEALREIGDASIISDLLEALHDKTDTVRKSAVIALGQVGDKDVVPYLLEALHDKADTVRKSAAISLRIIGDTSAVPGLLEALHDDRVRVREEAAKSLGEIGDASAVPGLLKGLNKDGATQRSAAEALGRIGDASAVPGLLEALHEEEWQILGCVIKALGKIKDASAVKGLLEFLYEENNKKIPDLPPKRDDFYRRQSLINIAVTDALVEIGDAAVPHLIDALHYKSWSVQKTAIEVLGKIGNTAAVPGLLEILQKEKSLRRSALEALMKIGDMSAVPGLLEALHDDDVNIRRSALEALRVIGDKSAVPSLCEVLRKDEDSFIREKATEVLGRIGDASAVLSLIEAVRNDSNQEVLRGASRALVKIGDSAVPNLLDALNDEKPSDRHKGIVANTLRQIDTSEVLTSMKANNEKGRENIV